MHRTLHYNVVENQSFKYKYKHITNSVVTYRVPHTKSGPFHFISYINQNVQFTFCCSNWSQSFLKLIDCPINQIRQTSVSSPVSPRQGSLVPRELLPPNIGRCQSSATSIFQPPPSCRTTTSSQHARPSGVLRRLSDGLECAAWRPPRPVAQCRQFPEDAKDASVSECTWTLSALEALRNIYIYNFIRQDWQQNKNGRKKNLN